MWITRARRDDLRSPHRLAMAPHGTRDFRTAHIGVCPHGSQQRMCLLCAAVIQRERVGRTKDLDAAEDLRRRFRSEALHAREAAVASSGRQRIHGIDAELLMQHVHFCNGEPRNPEQVGHAGRQAGLQFGEVSRLTGLDEVAHDRQRGLAEAGGARQRSVTIQGTEVIGIERNERSRRLFVCSALEGALAAQLEKRGDAGERVRGGTGIHSAGGAGAPGQVRIRYPRTRAASR